jgi:hypothetical protein
MASNSANAGSGVGLNVYSEILYGDAETSPLGTAVGIASVITVSASGHASNEHCPYFGWLRYDAAETPGRAWFADFSVHGAIDVQQSALNGITMFTNNYYDGSPADTPSGALWIVTAPGIGGGINGGEPADHVNSPTFAMDVGIGVIGNSYGNNRGFTTGVRIGGSGSGWGSATQPISRFATGLEVRDFDTIGVHISGRYSGRLEVGLELVLCGDPCVLLQRRERRGQLAAGGELECQLGMDDRNLAALFAAVTERASGRQHGVIELRVRPDNLGFAIHLWGQPVEAGEGSDGHTGSPFIQLAEAL